MQTIWIPFDLTALPQEQQDSMYVAWLKLVAAQVKELGFKALIAIDKKGDPGPLTTNLQGAQAWIGEFPVNVLIAFNDFFANDFPRQGSDVRRNDPVWYAASLVDRAKEKAAAQSAGTLGEYVVTPRPATGDIEV